jgi:hypothetical protein
MVLWPASTSRSRDFDDIYSSTMSHERPLQGACSCGRNRYLILVPEDATEKAQVIFDVSSEHRRDSNQTSSEDPVY